MCVAELALPVLPGLFLGAAQKFSIVFQLEVLFSVHGVPQRAEQSFYEGARVPEYFLPL